MISTLTPHKDIDSQLSVADLEPLLSSTPYDFDDEILSRPQKPRHLLLSYKAIILATIVVSAIVMSYLAQGRQMDRESAALMKSLDLEVAPSFYGPKTIDLYGQLRRADTSVVCKTVDVQGATVDYSNSAICMQNAEQHANCIRICDPAFSSCGGCAALAADRASQLATAQANCNYKSNFVCPLTTMANGAYNYQALSSCCLGSKPPGPASCLCENQQSASALCVLAGVCLGISTCQKSTFQCSGTSGALPIAVCNVAGALTCSGSGSSEIDLTCGIAGGNQYYLSPLTSKCTASCPSGYASSILSGVGTCIQCGTGVSTCSGTTALSCGTSGGVQYYLSSGTCLIQSACSSTVGTVSSGLGTCATCSDVGALTCSGTGTGKAILCGKTLALLQLYRSSSNTCVLALACGLKGVKTTNGVPVCA